MNTGPARTENAMPCMPYSGTPYVLNLEIMWMYPNYLDQNKYFNAIFGLVNSLFHFTGLHHCRKLRKRGLSPIWATFSHKVDALHTSFPFQLENKPWIFHPFWTITTDLIINWLWPSGFHWAGLWGIKNSFVILCTIENVIRWNSHNFVPAHRSSSKLSQVSDAASECRYGQDPLLSSIDHRANYLTIKYALSFTIKEFLPTAFVDLG
jgi:hypothetical protein